MVGTSSTVPLAARCDYFSLKNFRLQSGLVLPEAQLAYQTYGQLNADRSNVILYPTSYGAQHHDIEWLIGPDGILDSTKYFVIIPNMFGNGLSTSPSNLEGPVQGEWIPLFTHVDNVIAQSRMIEAVFGIKRIALAYGWSMGGQQALHWGAMFPDRVERIAAICTSSKTAPHNRVFLEGLRSVLTTDSAWVGDHFEGRPDRGLRAFGRVYAGWALSQEFYRKHVYLDLGYESLEDFLIRDWEASFLRRDAANLISMIETWKHSDISENETFHGDIEAALGAIQAQTWIMPSKTDLYFTPEDNIIEAQRIRNSRYLPIPSIWGHRAGNPSKSPEDQRFLKHTIAELMNTST